MLNVVSVPKQSPREVAFVRTLAVADLICKINERRSDYDPYKLPLALADAISQRLTQARMRYGAIQCDTTSVESASLAVQKARMELSILLKRAYKSLRSIPEVESPAVDVVQALETYGWERAQEGDLMSPSRIDILARLAFRVGPCLPPYLRYPDFITKGLAIWLGILDWSCIQATGHSGASAIHRASADFRSLRKAISRVRHYYSAASDYGEMTTEFGKVGMSARKCILDCRPVSYGTKADWKLSFLADRMQLRLTPAPKSAYCFQSWKQTEDEAPVLAGVSDSPEIGICDFSPLQPMKTYSFWVTAQCPTGVIGSRETISVHLPE